MNDRPKRLSTKTPAQRAAAKMKLLAPVLGRVQSNSVLLDFVAELASTGRCRPCCKRREHSRTKTVDLTTGVSLCLEAFGIKDKAIYGQQLLEGN